MVTLGFKPGVVISTSKIATLRLKTIGLVTVGTGFMTADVDYASIHIYKKKGKKTDRTLSLIKLSMT